MSREAYNSLPNIGTRASPGNRARRLTELPTVDRSPSRDFHRGSPLGNKKFILNFLFKSKKKTKNQLNPFICCIMYIYNHTESVDIFILYTLHVQSHI